MSLNILREFERANKNGVHFSTINKCIADEKLSHSAKSYRNRGVSQMLRDENINCTTAEFCKAVGISNKTLNKYYRNGNYAVIEKLIGEFLDNEEKKK